MDFSKMQYENVFEISEKDGKKTIKKIMARLFDPKTKESKIVDVTHLSIPDVFIDEGKPSQYKSYLDDSRTLTKYSFKTIQEYKKFVKKLKKDVLDENGEVQTKLIDYDGETLEIEISEFEDNAFGYQNQIHTFIRRYFPDHNASDHIHRTVWIDIETRSMTEMEYPDDYVVECEMI